MRRVAATTEKRLRVDLFEWKPCRDTALLNTLLRRTANAEKGTKTCLKLTSHMESKEGKKMTGWGKGESHQGLHHLSVQIDVFMMLTPAWAKRKPPGEKPGAIDEFRKYGSVNIRRQVLAEGFSSNR